MAKLYTIENHPRGRSAEPMYTIEDGKLYRTVFHPSGWSPQCDYELRKDGRIYRSKHHLLGPSDLPEFEFRSDAKLYRVSPNGFGGADLPEYELCD